VPNQVANNQVLTVKFLYVLQESNISVYQELAEGHSFSRITNKADVVICNMEYFRHNIWLKLRIGVAFKATASVPYNRHGLQYDEIS